jgi:hypothetical protein
MPGWRALSKLDAVPKMTTRRRMDLSAGGIVFAAWRARKGRL